MIENKYTMWLITSNWTTFRYIEYVTKFDGTHCLILCSLVYAIQLGNNNSSVALVRKQTIPTELLPLVGDISANF
jgi:hypothetical protein